MGWQVGKQWLEGRGLRQAGRMAHPGRQAIGGRQIMRMAVTGRQTL
jgi:hypothetical protein